MEEHLVYRATICVICDDRIEDDPVSYRDQVEVKGLGIAHAYCAEEYLEEANRSGM